jgi:ribosomal protein S18 acetylase RimI-like enzyme
MLLKLLTPLLMLFLPGIALAALVLFLRKRAYERTEYFAATHTPYRTVRRDLGLWGEYLTYRRLCDLPGEKKFLFNCYVPKDKRGYSEIDLILLHSSGVYVFESKNYSGWIFGNEADSHWTQSFRNGHKERFYSPIKQNSTHIRTLLHFLPGLSPEAVQSVIVFSERCTLRRITLTTDQHIVIKRDQLPRAIASLARRQIFNAQQIDALYQRLFPQTQLSPEEKRDHVNRVESRHDPRNPNSGKVMMKAGLKFEGVLRQSDWNNQGVCDAVYSAVLAEDYFAHQSRKAAIRFNHHRIDLATDKDYILERHCRINYECDAPWARKLTYDEYRANWFARAEQQEGFLAALIASMDNERALAEILRTETGETVGYLWVQFHGEDPSFVWAEIQDIYVEEAYRNNGVAAALMDYAEKSAKANGAKVIRSGTGCENIKSQGLHRRMGYYKYRFEYEKGLG